MYPLAHIGFALLVARVLRRNGKLVALGGMLPDIIDKPLSLLGIGCGRFVAHSLLFTVFVTLLNPDVGLGCVTHLILDRIWENPEVFFLPFLGIPPNIHYTVYDYLYPLLHDRFVQAGEVLGSACIAIYLLTGKFLSQSRSG